MRGLLTIGDFLINLNIKNDYAETSFLEDVQVNLKYSIIIKMHKN